MQLQFSGGVASDDDYEMMIRSRVCHVFRFPVDFVPKGKRRPAEERSLDEVSVFRNSTEVYLYIPSISSQCTLCRLIGH